MSFEAYFNAREESQRQHPLNADPVLQDVLEDQIDQAKQSIWVAVYSIRLDGLIEALQRAKNRGVDVKLILDGDKKDKFIEKYREKIVGFDLRSTAQYPSPVKGRKNLMHLKVMLVDPDDQDHATILTGTWNWTSIQEKYDPSNLLLIKDYELAKAYRQELERLNQNSHGEMKPKDPGYNPFALKKQFADGTLELWLSPRTESIAYFERIIELIRRSRKSIYIANWQFTNPKIAAELYKKHKNGIEIRIIADDLYFWEKESVFPNMWGVKNNPKAPVWNPPLRGLMSDYFRFSLFQHSYRSPESEQKPISSYFHQHFVIIDEKIVITGSGNWTAGSEWSNDEDALILTQQKAVGTFLKYFWHHYAALGGRGPKSELALEVRRKPFSLKLKNLSRSSQKLSGYQILSARSNYDLNQFKAPTPPEEIQSMDFKRMEWIPKNPFDVGVIALRSLKLGELDMDTSLPLLDPELLKTLFPEDERKNPIEVYLLNERQELVASTRVFSNDFED